jgi:hypothetical protein
VVVMSDLQEDPWGYGDVPCQSDFEAVINKKSDWSQHLLSSASTA